ncbi:hypothetical protein D3C80_1257770 [compost metagenome]
MLHDKPADQRPDNRSQTKHAAKQPLITAAIGRRNDIGHRGHTDHHQPTAAQALQSAHQHQLGHILRQPAERGAHKEEYNRDLQNNFSAKQIAKLTVQRYGNR